MATVYKDEITSWLREHAASKDYECDMCGHEIYYGDLYYRRVFREQDKRRTLTVERHHGSCPDWRKDGARH